MAAWRRPAPPRRPAGHARRCSRPSPRPTCTATSTARSGSPPSSTWPSGRGCGSPPTRRRGWPTAIHQGQVCRSLEDYLTAFDVTLAVLQTEEALQRVAYELALDCAAENVRYLEVRYSPVLHTRRGAEADRHRRRGARRPAATPSARPASESHVIVCGIRHMDPDTSVRLAELAVAYKGKGVVGFDLAGAEEGNPPSHHREALQLILDNNVNLTIHAGEAYGPESIAQAVHVCGAHRIGHGVRLRENGDLLNYVNDHRIPLEMCLSSNVQTGAVTGSRAHPLRFYFDFGLRVTINTDNRLITDTTCTTRAAAGPPRAGLHAGRPLRRSWCRASRAPSCPTGRSTSCWRR